MLAFLGGTGPEGRGLALRYALEGQKVVLGSRDQERALVAARGLKEMAPQAQINGAENAEAARQGDVVFITVPYEAQKPLLATLAPQLEGKVVISVVAPLAFERGRARALQVPEGSAAVQAQQLLPRSLMVGAFQNLSAVHLLNPRHVMEGDVIVCSDHPEAKAQVMDLVRLIKDLRPVDGGGLENSRYVEELTTLLLHINRIYKAHSTIRIVGV